MDGRGKQEKMRVVVWRLALMAVGDSSLVVGTDAATLADWLWQD
jgi:hypothetical protein